MAKNVLTNNIFANKRDGAGTPKVSCRNVWKVFGADPMGTIEALETADQSKDGVLADSGDIVAVRDVSFDVQEGETFVVMGLSGSGKSTLLRCLPRLIDPTAGEIIVDGVDMATVEKEQLRTLRRHMMSMVFQHFGLFPHRTILDNVAFGLEVQGIRKAERHAKAREVIGLVNLAGWENYYPGQLSGGMQQRVGLARALAVDPEILLFDEPFSALDPLIRREMQDELINLQQKMQKTLIFITHDFNEAIKLGDHIAIMKDGEFVQVGTSEEVVLHPADDYVAEFTHDVPRVKVVTARTAMQPVGDYTPEGPAITAGAKLEQIMSMVANNEAPLPVVDADEMLVGQISQRDILMVLSQNGKPA